MSSIQSISILPVFVWSNHKTLSIPPGVLHLYRVIILFRRKLLIGLHRRRRRRRRCLFLNRIFRTITTQILSFDYLLVYRLLYGSIQLVLLIIYYWRCLPWYHHGHDKVYFYFRCCCYHIDRSWVSSAASVRWSIRFFVFSKKCKHLSRKSYFYVQSM